jgi:formamidopyrimidine-DNA glycosylase
MPELPEVHTTAQILNKLISGLKIQGVWTSYGGIIHRGKQHIKNKKYFARFRKAVIGQKVKNVSRRGKNVLINLSSDQIILIHMKMTGHLLYGKYFEAVNSKNPIPSQWQKEKWLPAEIAKSPLWDDFNRFIRMVISFSNGKHLALSDVRKFAKVCLINRNEKNELSELGPEPLKTDFKFQTLKSQIFKRPNGKIKQVLMDQKIIAGIGNIYSDEILWLAKIHPESRVSKLPTKILREMYRVMKKILKKGIDFGGDSTSDYRQPSGKRGAFQYHHKVYRQTGQKCPKKKCGGIINRIKIGGRSAHFCPKHQKLFK